MGLLARILAEGCSPIQQLNRLRVFWVFGGVLVFWLCLAVSWSLVILLVPLLILVTARLVGIRCPRCGGRAFVRGIFYMGSSRCQKCGVRFE